MEDRQIVELYWQKNTNAIKETDSKYGAYCFTIADNILHNKEDSEECVNDTWLNAWNSMPRVHPTICPGTSRAGWQCVPASLLFYRACGRDCQAVWSDRKQCHGDSEPDTQEVEKTSHKGGIFP